MSSLNHFFSRPLTPWATSWGLRSMAPCIFKTVRSRFHRRSTEQGVSCTAEVRQQARVSCTARGAGYGMEVIAPLAGEFLLSRAGTAETPACRCQEFALASERPRPRTCSGGLA